MQTHFTFSKGDGDLHFAVEWLGSCGRQVGALLDPSIHFITVEEVCASRSLVLINRGGKAILLEETMQGVATDTGEFKYIRGAVTVWRCDSHVAIRNRDSRIKPWPRGSVNISTMYLVG